jgi:hypothetical protein
MQPVEKNSFGLFWSLPIACFILYSLFTSVSLYLEESTEPLYNSLETKESVVSRLKLMSSKDKDILVQKQNSILANNPFDKTALTNLRLLMIADNKTEQADRLIKEAAALSLRDGQAVIDALSLQIKSGDYSAAFRGIDALLRTEAAPSEKLYEVLAGLSANPNVKSELVQLLASEPPWRVKFLNWAAQNSDRPDLAYDIMTELKSRNVPLIHWEIMVLVRRYIVNKQFESAYYVWLSLLPEYQLSKVRNIFDGNFDLPLSSFFFDWTPIPSDGIAVDTIPRSQGNNDKILRVQFQNDRKTVNPVYQLLRLSPGQYVFSGSYRSENLQSQDTLVWRITCIEGPHAEIASVPSSPGTNPWQGFETEVDVPEDCPTQKLSLEMRSNATLNQKISGTSYFDNLQITRKQNIN